jgi:hypothetical protein
MTSMATVYRRPAEDAVRLSFLAHVDAVAGPVMTAVTLRNGHQFRPPRQTHLTDQGRCRRLRGTRPLLPPMARPCREAGAASLGHDDLRG